MTNEIRSVNNLNKAQEYITKAIGHIEMAGKLTPHIKSAAESYTIPWLEAFRSSENQTGSISELIERIERP